MNTRFSEWQQLAADVRQRTQDNMTTLQTNNAALPTDIVPAANEKLMNTIQLKRIAGEPLTEEERNQMEELEGIQLFNAFGQSVRYQHNTADARMEVSLPCDLKAGIYFLCLQLRSGEIHTQKILIQP